MRGRILKTITATTLAGIMLVASSGCGSNQPTTTASSTPTVDVIKQIEEDCGIRSQRGETVFYEWWSYDRDDDTVQCLLNVMPEDVYEQYNGGKGASADAYMDDGDASYEDTVGSGDYRWTWHIYYFGSGSTFKTMSNIRVDFRYRMQFPRIEAHVDLPWVVELVGYSCMRVAVQQCFPVWRYGEVLESA